MRIVLLTHYYAPEVGAPQTRLAELAARLHDLGHHVTVHTGFPHYPAGRILPPYRNRPLLRERGAGPAVVRSWVYPVANRGFGRRLANHLSFAGSSLATAAASGPADVVVAETPPLFLAAASVAYARAKRAPLVLHVADLWPASAVALGALHDPRAIRLAERMEAWAYARAAAIAVPTAGMERELGRHPAAAGKVERIGPAVDLARFAPLGRPPAAAPLEVLYAGTVGLAQGIDTLVEAAALAGPRTVRVTIAGDGVEAGRVAGEVARRALANVRVLGAAPAAEVPSLYGAAHAGAVLLRDRPLFEGALPTKLLECMAAGRPVLLSARGEAADLVRRTGAGIVVPPEDAAALADGFRALAADPSAAEAMGERGREAALAEFDRGAYAGRWAALLERVSGRGGTRRTPASAGPRRPAARS